MIRHGKTELNKANVLQGRSNYPLNDEGIRQAEDAAKMLESIDFDHVYSSPMIRAVQTAEIVAPDKEIRLDDRRRRDKQRFRRFIEAAVVCDNDKCVELVVIHEVFLSKINQKLSLNITNKFFHFFTYLLLLIIMNIVSAIKFNNSCI